jgi:hypothetical protein
MKTSDFDNNFLLLNEKIQENIFNTVRMFNVFEKE